MKRFRLFGFFTATIFTLIACSTSPTVSPSQLKTEVAHALAETLSANKSTPLPTNTQAYTNTPRPTNIPRPTATLIVGNLKSPFLYGEIISLTNTKSNGEETDWSLQILDIIRGDQANAIIYQANQFNDDPPAGSSWMLIQVKVTLVSGAAFRMAASDFAVISGGQYFAGIQLGNCCTKDIGFPELDANIALAGTSVEGWIIRPVLLNDEKPLLALNIDPYNPNLDKGLFFALYK